MSKNISVSDDVYKRLKREKDGKSFSDVIGEKIESGGRLSEVSGNKVLDRDTMEKVKEDVRTGSGKTLERLEE
ncbi:MAG: antitoxin VapB family protein [Candidatus Nanohalobium sp.]